MHRLHTHIKYILVFVLAVLVCVVWYAVFVLEGQSGVLTVSFLDVGQGDAIFIETPSNNQVLIDGGPNKAVLVRLAEVMPFWDRSLDAVLATHPHADHIGGLIEVLRRYQVDYIFDSGISYESSVFQAWQNARNAEGARIIRTRRGTEIMLDKDIRLEVLLPLRRISEGNPNDASIVARLEYNNTCFFLTGDMERRQEFLLASDLEYCDVLKIAHHGSQTSTSNLFLERLSPAIAVVSAGTDNRFGHPHDAIVQKLATYGIPLFRTDKQGTVTVYSDGSRIWTE